jgi:NAD(P)-dependent dehydrogenase (short-subunit alcohol dehydrogenase family)
VVTEQPVRLPWATAAPDDKATQPASLRRRETGFFRAREEGGAGATSGIKGRKGYINLAVGKFGLRALAQVMASELGPQGVHVAHVVIDGDIAESDEPSAEKQIEPLDWAQTFYMLHRQPRSCWTSEIDVRPSGEVFWEHC